MSTHSHICKCVLAALQLQILEQDLPAGVPIVLLVSDIRSRSSSSSSTAKPTGQQQSTGAGSEAEVLGIQLSDGWYYVNAMIDGPLTDLIASGRLQVGDWAQCTCMTCTKWIDLLHSMQLLPTVTVTVASSVRSA